MVLHSDQGYAPRDVPFPLAVNFIWMISEFTEENGGTIVKYTLFMQPAFWVPPAIGPYLIKRKLKNEGDRALGRIEALAQALGDGDRTIFD